MSHQLEGHEPTFRSVGLCFRHRRRPNLLAEGASMKVGHLARACVQRSKLIGDGPQLIRRAIDGRLVRVSVQGEVKQVSVSLKDLPVLAWSALV